MLQGKENDKNYHICALHDPLFDEEAVAQKEQSDENSDILPSERENSMDRDFINDDITDEAGTESQNSQESQSFNDDLVSALENSIDRDFIKYVKKDKAQKWQKSRKMTKKSRKLTKHKKPKNDKN